MMTKTTTGPAKRPGEKTRAAREGSWFKAHWSPGARELMKASLCAFLLLGAIAWRARCHDGFNTPGLEPGEVPPGDYKNCGMSRSNYRSAVKQLQKWGFVTITPTSKGTIGKSTNTRVFGVCGPPARQPGDQPLTSASPPTHQPVATNLEGIERKEGIEGVTAPPGLAGAENWQLMKDLQALTTQIRATQEARQPDVNLIAGSKTSLATINAEWRPWPGSALPGAAASSQIPQIWG